MEKCLFSKRIYKTELSVENVSAIEDTLVIFNKAKHYAYKLLLDEHNYNLKYKDSVHMQIKNRYNLNDYFSNSAVQEAKAILSSQKELSRLNQSNLKEQIKSRKKKIKDLKAQIKRKEQMLKTLIKGKFKTYKGANEFQINSIYGVRYKKYTRIFFIAYDFEHQHLRPQIKQLKNKVKMVEFGLKRKSQKLEKIKSYLSGATFGSKKLFKAQFTKKEYINNHKSWLEDFRNARYSTMQISGRKDAKHGNFVFKYNHANQELEIALLGKTITIKDLAFPYRQEDLDTALINRKAWKKPVAWEIKDKGDYYIFKAIVHVPKNKINYSKESGLIGIDINYDHLALVEIDQFGNILAKKTLYFNLEGKTTGQASKIIEGLAIQVIDIANDKKKPIVLEKLNTSKSKSKLTYGNKKANRKITQFAYKKIIDSIYSRAHKIGVAVFSVNPAYTSQIGKFKHMKPKGLSIHLAAAYVIARRKMGFKEKVPPELFNMLPEKIAVRHHWAHWNYISRQLKDIKPHRLYQGLGSLGDCSSLKDIKKLLESAEEGLKQPSSA